MKTPFMEVIRFDAENIIATSGGPAPATLHSWDAVNRLLTCPQGSGAAHFKTITIDSSGHDLFGKWYEDGYDPDDDDYPVTVFVDPAVGNWYIFDGGKFVKCQ